MNKKRIKALKEQFFKEYNRMPNKSELRRLKKNFLTGITTRIIDHVLPKPMNLSIMRKDEKKVRDKEIQAVADHVFEEANKHKSVLEEVKK